MTDLQTATYSIDPIAPTDPTEEMTDRDLATEIILAAARRASDAHHILDHLVEEHDQDPKHVDAEGIAAVAALIDTAHIAIEWSDRSGNEQVDVLAEIAAERRRQDEKWGEQNHPDGTGPETKGHAYTADAVDAARLAKRICQFAAQAGTVTWRQILDEEVRESFAESDPEKLRVELIQVAAVAAQWVEAIDRRARRAEIGGESA